MENIGVYVTADKLLEEIKRSGMFSDDVSALVLRDTVEKKFVYAVFDWERFNSGDTWVFEEVEIDHSGNFKCSYKMIHYALTVKNQKSPCLPGIRVIDYDVLDII